MSNMTDACILEVDELNCKALRLSRGSSSDRKEADVLSQRAGFVERRGFSTNEMRQRYTGALVADLTPSIPKEKYQRAFFRYINSRTSEGEREIRDLTAGTQSIVYSAGPAGGYTIPIESEATLFEASAQVDPLLSPSVCNFTMEPSPILQPKQISGYDLSTISASLIGEGAAQGTGSFPTVAGRVLRGNLIYKTTIGASIESEQDIPQVLDKFSRAFGVAFARKLGADAILGNGTTQPQGLLTALPTPIYSTGAGKITLTDLNSIFFGVNYVYRAQPLCGWLFSDSVYQRIRSAVDLNGRPLISVTDGEERLLGKQFNISPSLGVVGGSPSSNSTIVFGDFGQFHIRSSRPTVQRLLNSPIADIVQGKALYLARIRMDSALFDPSGGSAPPIVTATITA